MKNLIVLFLLVSLVSCKKEPMYGPFNLKDGQEVELLVDHRYGSDQDIVLKSPELQPTGSGLVGFEQREPGYSYRVKARFRHEDNPPQDASASSFEFLNVISKEQYKGTDAFDIQIIVSYIPGGPVIRLNKVANDFYFIPEKLQLTYSDSAVEKQLEDIWQDAQDIRANWKLGQRPKWKAIKATVVHDPQKFGKAYLVKQIQFL